MNRLLILAAALASSPLAACSSSDKAAASPSVTGDAGTGGSKGAGGAPTADSGTGGKGGAGGGGAGELTLTSGVFKDGEYVPASSRCVAPSPDVAWTGGPDAKSYALVFQDQTPGISKGFLHWVIYDIEPATHALDASEPIGYEPGTPPGAHQAPIWNGTLGFNGPCGGDNVYTLTLYALSEAPLGGLSAASSGPDTVTAIEGKELAHAVLTVHSKP